MARIAGPHGGMTPEQLDHFQHVVDTGGGITADDSPSEAIEKLKNYNNAVERLHDLGGGDGPLHYAQVPEGGFSGHYEIDPDALQDIINEWKDIIDSLTDDQVDIDRIRGVEPPAPDQPASVAQARKLSEFGDRMHDRNKSMLDYAKMYLKSLMDTKDEYDEQERHAQETMREQMGDT